MARTISDAEARNTKWADRSMILVAAGILAFGVILTGVGLWMVNSTPPTVAMIEPAVEQPNSVAATAPDESGVSGDPVSTEQPNEPMAGITGDAPTPQGSAAAAAIDAQLDAERRANEELDRQLAQGNEMVDDIPEAAAVVTAPEADPVAEAAEEAVSTTGVDEPVEESTVPNSPPPTVLEPDPQPTEAAPPATAATEESADPAPEETDEAGSENPTSEPVAEGSPQFDLVPVEDSSPAERGPREPSPSSDFQLGEITIDSMPDGTSVFIDRTQITKAPTTLLVPWPASYEVTVRSGSEDVFSTRLTLTADNHDISFKVEERIGDQ